MTSLVTATPTLKDRILMVNGVSKAYAMIGGSVMAWDPHP